ncbi:MAG: phasin family protein [Desulfotignum sp.]|nr:phasin family protein [Desulfotignum sp.]
MSNNMDFGTNWEGFVKSLLQRLDMPTKEDINHLHDRLDALEQLIQQKKPGAKKQPRKRTAKRKNASATTLEIIAGYPDGTDFKTIKAATGFDDKKLRNIIYRLDTLGKIQRVSRGIYKTT